VINVPQHCQISRVRRDLAQYAGTVALATTPNPVDLVLIVMTLVQRVFGRAAWACLCQATSKWLNRPFSTPASKWCCLELPVYDRTKTNEPPVASSSASTQPDAALHHSQFASSQQPSRTYTMIVNDQRALCLLRDCLESSTTTLYGRGRCACALLSAP
jgi:hypothetical protein